MDDHIREYSYDALRRWCAAMPDGHFMFVFRLMLAFAVPLAVCALAFHRGSRSSLVHWFCLTAGVLAALGVPLETAPQNEHVRLWLFVFSVLLLACIPAILPFYLARKYGSQVRLRVAFYVILAVVLLGSVCGGCMR
jgi:hypothetical protein